VDVQRAAASFHRGAVDDELLAIVDGRGGDSPAGAAWRTSLAFLYAELGRLEEARAELQRASAAPESLPRDANWLFTMSALGVTAGLLADAARAEPLYELLLPYAGRVVCTGRATDIDGASSYSLGLLAAALGRFGEAEEHFEGALRLNEAIGAPPHVARTKLRYAELLERRRSRSDVERAAELREGALAAAQRLGMRGLVRQLSSEA
jgi:tetratricopeptide (TPR) repeat protein